MYSAAAKAKLNAFFRTLRNRHHLVAKQEFSCCGGCASYEISCDYGALRDAGKGEDIAGAVFYHKQDRDTLRRTGKLYLRFGQITYQDLGQATSPLQPKYRTKLSTEEVGQLACRELATTGLPYTWNGKANECILVDLREE